MLDDDLVVEIPASEPEVKEVPKAEAKPEIVKKAEEPVVDPVADLKNQLATMSAERVAATQEAERVRQELARSEEAKAKAETALGESNVSVIDNALAAAQSEADGFQREQQGAFEAGDFAKAADFGRKMAKAEARVAQLESGKADLEYRAKAEAAKPKVEPKAEQRSSDPFEATLSGLTQRTAKWMRDQKTAGRDYITDKKLSAQAASAHYAALAEGLSVDTDPYFEFCETRLGLRKAAEPEPAPKANGGAQRTTTMPAAPVTRESSPSGGQLSATKVVLTPGEQRAAQDGTVVWNVTDPARGAVKNEPVGLREYARRKLEMQKEGRYGVLSDS